MGRIFKIDENTKESRIARNKCDGPFYFVAGHTIMNLFWGLMSTSALLKLF